MQLSSKPPLILQNFKNPRTHDTFMWPEAKLESKGNVLKRGLGVKIYKFGKIIRELENKPKRHGTKQEHKLLMGYI